MLEAIGVIIAIWFCVDIIGMFATCTAYALDTEKEISYKRYAETNNEDKDE